MPRGQLLQGGMGLKSGGPFLDYLFDQGSLSSYTITDPVAPTIRLVPNKIYLGTWSWWCVRSKRWAGKTPHFLIDKADHYSLMAGEWLACWATSENTDTWIQFDNITIGATDIEIYHNTAFPSGTIYVAASPMYPFSRTAGKIATWSASSLVDETPSTTNFIAGYQTVRALGDGSGRIAPALPYYGFKVENATANPKNIGVLQSGVHANEVQGRFTLEGAIDWLLTTGDYQKFLLDWFTFYVYPCMFPQAVHGGFTRSSPQTPNNSCDYIWDTTGFNEVVDDFKAIFTTDTGDAADLAVDFHGYFSSVDYRSTAFDSTVAIWVAFKAFLLSLVPTYSALADIPDSGGKELTGYWAHMATPPDFFGWLEMGLSSSITPTLWKAYGANCMKAFTLLLAGGYFDNGPGVGSRNFNGMTDRIDWANVFNTAGSAITISAWVYVDTLPGAGVSEYIFCTHRAGDTSFGTVFNFYGNGGLINFFRNGTTLLTRLSSGTVSTGVWTHVLVTHDGEMTTYSSIHFFINGVSGDSNVSAANGAGEYASTGQWSLGGRIYDDARNSDGRIAQVGVWNRVLTSTEIANLAAGYAPDLAAASGLQFYFKGNTSSLAASPGGTGTADGTSHLTGVGNGPRIIY